MESDFYRQYELTLILKLRREISICAVDKEHALEALRIELLCSEEPGMQILESDVIDIIEKL